MNKILFIFHVFLMAIKNHRHYNFKSGMPVKIIYKKENNLIKTKGRLQLTSSEGLYVSSFKKRDTALTYIPINSLTSITKLLRKDRLSLGIGGSILLSAGILFASQNNNGAVDNYDFIFYIFGVLPGAGFIISIPITYLQEIITEKSIKRGWHFEIH